MVYAETKKLIVYKFKCPNCGNTWTSQRKDNMECPLKPLRGCYKKPICIGGEEL